MVTSVSCQCGGSVGPGENFCAACGSPVGHPPPVPIAPVAASTPPTTALPEAGARSGHTMTSDPVAGNSEVADLEDPAAGPSSAMPRRKLLALGTAVALIVVVFVVAVVASNHGNHSSKSDGGGAAASSQLTPAQNCFNVVWEALVQVPRALADGYSNGIKADPISTEYGYQSAEFTTFVQAQARLINNIVLQGDPGRQLAAIGPYVEQGCASATR